MDQYRRHLNMLLDSHQCAANVAHQKGDLDKWRYLKAVIGGIQLAIEAYNAHKEIEKENNALDDEGRAQRLLPASGPEKIQ